MSGIAPINFDPARGLSAAQRLDQIDGGLRETMWWLATGRRINSAADDAAGLSIVARLRAQLRGAAAARDNAYDGQLMLNTADTALDNIGSMLGRVRELAVQYRSGTLDADDKARVQAQADALMEEAHRIGADTEYNSSKLLDGSVTQRTFAISPDGRTSSVTVAMPAASDLIGAETFDLSSTTALRDISSAVDRISEQRATIGSTTERLDSAARSLSRYEISSESARSRIEDADMAHAMVTLMQLRLQQQVTISMLAQANRQDAGAVHALLRP